MRQLRLGTFIKADGDHLAAWRHRTTGAKGGTDFESLVKVARAAEAGKLDFLFMADVSASVDLPAEKLGRCSWFDRMEPLTALTALAPLTKHIGLVGTATTTYNEPYALARRISSIDHVSAGRAGWNVVTTLNHTDAMNYGTDRHEEMGKRYERAEEFVDVVRGLWDCWREDDIVRDKESGIYFSNTELPYLNHRGKYFQVRGPIDQAPPPQGHPVIVQAGASNDGRELAARTADVVFVSQQDIGEAQKFYADIKARAEKYGRADHILVLAGLQPFVGRTLIEARAKLEELQDLLDPGVALAMLTTLLGGTDLTSYPLDEPLTQLPPAIGLTSRRDSILALAKKENLTLRQLAKRVVGSRGHKSVIGLPDDIADHMEQWFESRAADGFLLLPSITPDAITDFVELVIPVLQKRNLFRREYEGQTLRENLGLPRPLQPGRTANARCVGPSPERPSQGHKNLDQPGL
jgi:N-acetyl-S-(2-succino)cysteine monooxygenase